ncbi:phytoene desaturase family protein [Clostridium senegalense]
MGEKVIVIGGGIGGLATGLRLLKNGYDVKIIEKECRVGGKVNLLKEKNFKFDLTASILMIIEPYKELIEYIDKDFSMFFNVKSINPIYRVFSYENKYYDFNNELYKLMNTLEDFSQKDSYGYIKFLGDTYKHYIAANNYFLCKSQINKFKILKPKNIKVIESLKTSNCSYHYIKKFIDNNILTEFLAFQSMYVGISPFDGPSIYTLIPMISQLHGLWHIEGGMYRYVEVLEKFILELGGEIECGKNVEKIHIEDNKVVGVITNKGLEKCDLVVCNSDFSYTIEKLLSENNSQLKIGKYTMKKIQYTCSTFIMYLALNKKYDILKVHNIYLNKNFKDNTQKIFIGELPIDPSIYIYCPSKIDNTINKNGEEMLNIIVRVPNLCKNSVEWNENTIILLKEKILSILLSIDGLQDLKEHIIYENYLTPKDLESKFNCFNGCAFGISPTLSQTNWFRPQCKIEKLKNLYFVGDSIHPGAGVAMVLKSSKIVTDEILKDFKNIN